MNVLYYESPLSEAVPSPSMFLAGPSPRSPDVASWRPDAIALLQGLGFVGSVLVPEWGAGLSWADYLDHVEWEFTGLEGASVIAFWVPRNLSTLPGFTTNVEFGRYVGSGRVVYGRPDDAPKNRYLDWLYHKCTGLTPCRTLEETLRVAISRAANGHQD